MDTVLWIVQAILAIKFTVTAVGHGLIRSREMRDGIVRMGFAQAQPALAATSILLLVGSLGMVAPAVLPDLPGLAPGSAALLAVLMMASTTMHPGCREKQQWWASAIIFVLCIFVVAGRLSNP